MGDGSQRKSLYCWVGIHKWVTRTNADARWQECGHCGKFSGKVVTANRFPPGGSGDSGSGGF
jgi:hypothetical protein